MNIGIVGMSAKTSCLELRERWTKAAQYVFSKEQPLLSVLLTTCHRTEIYFAHPDLHWIRKRICALFSACLADTFEPHLYWHFNQDCFVHLARVASGLDSIVLLETEIQGQIKKAYSVAAQTALLPSAIHFLFQKAFKIAKEIRRSVPPLEGKPSLEETLLSLFTFFFHPIDNLSILFVGNSLVNRKILSYFYPKRRGRLALCSRSGFSDSLFKSLSHVEFFPWEKRKEWKQFDVVISATDYSGFVICAEEMSGEEMQNLLLIDLSVPRTIDPSLKTNPDILLLNMQEIEKLIETKRIAFLKYLEHFEKKIRQLVQRQIEIYTDKRITPCGIY